MASDGGFGGLTLENEKCYTAQSINKNDDREE
jgi:hypothetical protein